MSQYEELENIGHGSFGIIRKVRRKSDGRIFCRKEINYVKMTMKERSQLHSEFSILHSLNHPNIVGYVHREHFKDTRDVHLYMEYCGNGDLGKYIRKLIGTNTYAQEDFVWGILAQLLTALHRCHYGEDAPEVGSNVYRPSKRLNAPEQRSSNQVVILHRDLKPENVFLGEDNSVKLGDFGLSKIMQSHDFASTYVGTPFYMSPEICSEERYTLKSDIWSLGCIIYELCARKPPFNAKTHLNLIKSIKHGVYDALPPSLYSAELSEVIRSCLKVNPMARPDTAELLEHPAVKLMRKEREVIDVGRSVKQKEEMLTQKLLEAEARLAAVESEKAKMRNEIDSVVRREWEVKARLEINAQIQAEKERLTATFDEEVRLKVQAELQKYLPKQEEKHQQQNTFHRQEHKENVPPLEDIPQSSVSSNNDGEFPSVTDLTSLSLESPVATTKTAALPMKKPTRTPFGRAQTMFVDSPADVQMADPSPMSIASLALSPRRNGNRSGGAGNVAKKLFAAANKKDIPHPLQNAQVYHSDEEEGDGDHDEEPFGDGPDSPAFQSPTQEKSRKAAAPPPQPQFKKPPMMSRPALVTQKTAPIRRPGSKPNLFATAASQLTKDNPRDPTIPTLTTNLPPQTTMPPPALSPSARRISKIPSATTIQTASQSTDLSSSPIRRSRSSKALLATTGNIAPHHQTYPQTATALKDDPQKQTRPSAPPPRPAVVGQSIIQLSSAAAGGSTYTGTRPGSSAGRATGDAFADRAAAAGNMLDVAPVWPDDGGEMPSPFISRVARGTLGTGRYR